MDGKDGMGHQTQPARLPRRRGSGRSPSRPYARLQQKPPRGDGQQGKDPKGQKAGRGNPVASGDQDEDDAIGDPDAIVHRPAQRPLVRNGCRLGDGVMENAATGQVPGPAPDHPPVRRRDPGKAGQQHRPDIHRDGAQKPHRQADNQQIHICPLFAETSPIPNTIATPRPRKT